MILIADSGSTKTSWCLINNTHREFFETEGYNPYFMSESNIVNSLNKNLPVYFNPDSINEIYFYGAGCSSTDKINLVVAALSTKFKKATIQVNHDLLAAARALLGNEPGFAAILGTGTNSCLYDGNDITFSIDSLGYFLGDEGSATYIGKRLLRDYFRNKMPSHLKMEFQDKLGLSKTEVLDKLYNEPLPNRFLAQYSTFLFENKESEYAHIIAEQTFDSFFKELVIHYPNYTKYLFNCVGSIAFVFREELTKVSRNYEMNMGKIIRSPIEDLVKYHML